MSESIRTSNQPSLGDRYAELTVIAVTVIALFIGWFFKSSVESRSVPFQSGNLSAQVPAGWLQVKPEKDELLHVVDRTASGFATTYIVTASPVSVDSEPGQFISLLTLERGQALTAYRVLDQQKVSINGREAYELSYVYVETNPNVTQADMPSVVRGLDYIFFTGEQAVVATCQFDAASYEDDLAGCHRFLTSVEY